MIRRFIGAAILVGALAACSAASSTTPPAASATTATPPPGAVAITVMDFMLSKPAITVAGPTVTFVVTNDGPTPHNVAVRNAGGKVLMTTHDLSRGQSETISAAIPPGAYTTFCSLAGHESLGVKGTLTVTAP